MDLGAAGVSVSLMGEGNSHRDFDGSPMPSDIMDVDDVIAVCRELTDRDQGMIQVICQIGPGGDRTHAERIAIETGRPVNHNVFLAIDDDAYTADIAWLDRVLDAGGEPLGPRTAVPGLDRGLDQGVQHRLWHAGGGESARAVFLAERGRGADRVGGLPGPLPQQLPAPRSSRRRVGSTASSCWRTTRPRPPIGTSGAAWPTSRPECSDACRRCAVGRDRARRRALPVPHGDVHQPRPGVGPPLLAASAGVGGCVGRRRAREVDGTRVLDDLLPDRPGA